MNIRLILSGLVALAAVCAIPETTCGQTGRIFISNGQFGKATIQEYSTDGAVLHRPLISGLAQFQPSGIAVSGQDLFVTDTSSLNTIGKYTTSGATVNPALISGLNSPVRIAVSGEFLYVTNLFGGVGTIGKYTTSGATVNAALVSGLDSPQGIAVSGDKLFVTNAYGGTVGKYTTSGVPVNPALIDGLNFPVGIDVLGDSLFVVNVGNGTIGKYTTSGVPVNPSLVSGLRPWGGIAVVSAPVPDASSTWTLLLLGLTATFGLKPLLLRPA